MAPSLAPTPLLDVPRNSLALAIAQVLVGTGAGLSFAATAHGQTQQSGRAPQPASEELEEIIVTDSPAGRYVSEDSSLTKLTEGLLDTPQSITTVPQTLLDDRGVSSLNDALRNVPGITLGAGEFSWQGNNPSIRGFNARDDMYLDGIRDFGSYPRDPFNLESVEVLLGPSSVLFGRGSTGGAVNQVSKRPVPELTREISVNIGSDDTFRTVADLGGPLPSLGSAGAFRLNLMGHQGGVADRDGAETKRFGIAPSLAMEIGSASELTLSYMKQRSDDRPDYGLPWLNGEPAPVRRSNYYGFDSDYLETDVDIATVGLAHAASDTVHVDATLRYAEYSRESRITEPLITETVTPDTPLSDVSVYRYVFLGDSRETLVGGQGSVTMDLQTGTVRHALVTGVEYTRETSAPIFSFGVGAPGTDLLEPTPSDPFTAVTTDPRVSADTTGGTLAVYALDTLHFGPSWQTVIGMRWDRFDTDYDATRYEGPATPFNSGDVGGSESFDQIDKVLSYRAAVVYKPTPATSWYFAGSTAFNPSAQSLSFLTSGRGLGTGNVFLDPEKNRSFEAGFKSEIRDGALLFTGAVFEITKTNARIPDPSNPGFNTLGGEQRIRGMSLSLDGNLTRNLTVSSGYTYLDGETVKGAAGSTAGADLANAPEHSLSVWFNYRWTDRFELGVGARHVSEQLAQNTGGGKSVPGYGVLDVMGRYRLSDTVTVKLNLANITDEYYFDQLHPWHVVPGAGFTTTLAINVVY